MSPYELPPEERLTRGDLIAELITRSTELGGNHSEWPGLTTYRFTRVVPLQWAVVESLALCCVIQGRKRVIVEGREHQYDPFHYLVFTRGMRYQTEVLEASIEKPFLSFVLQIAPAIVRSVLSEMADRRTTTFAKPTGRWPAAVNAYVSPIDQNLTGAVLRFMRSLSEGPDRRVLAPIFLREIIYRLLQAEQVSRLVAAADTERENNPVSEIIRHIRERMSEPLTVSDMAHRVQMSPSALSTVFAEVTGMGPYQFVKRMRLDRAGTLLVQSDLNVTEVARQVGYTSLSHFTHEFKRYYGATPRAYAAQRRAVVPGSESGEPVGF
ncbi:transcriptional regulator [Pseudonocardia sulfidoxydans NBRC 16205]|uniref:Transcriptional regulator n=1 Tax=Pseudonocardia sulfidoxydans NBRC 16205 TaxID=1223511 RepID=A0A511DNY6_9PSEU|nr:transcriptional regulator [Pseudonocardia sulfidoxydans NBRC 16205]